MRIQTFSIVVGSSACNAHCPFCISGMTGYEEMPKTRGVNWINFEKAARLAEMSGSTTVLFTGKGEPTLYPNEITTYLGLLEKRNFPLIELQTNALEIGRLFRDGTSKIPGLTIETLQLWHALGLNTIAISTVGIHARMNRAVYADDYPDLRNTIRELHKLGFTVRLGVMMVKGGVDTPERLEELLAFAREQRIEQVSIRPLRKPEDSHDAEASKYVMENGVTDDVTENLLAYVQEAGTLIMSLMHGAKVFDVAGQNLCLTDCLTMSPEGGEEVRTLIFYSNGRLSYDWQYAGATILGGWDEAAESDLISLRKK